MDPRSTAEGDGISEGPPSLPPREDIPYPETELSNTILSLLANAAAVRNEVQDEGGAREEADPPPTEGAGIREEPIINIHNNNLRVFSIFTRAGNSPAATAPSPGSTPIARRLRSRGRR